MGNKKNLSYIGITVAAVILTIGGGLGFYFAKSGAYQETFMPNTTINGMSVAGKNMEEVKEMIEEKMAGYELHIIDRTGAGEVIKKEEINLRTEFDGGLERVLAMQEPTMWIKSLWTEVDYRIGTMLVYDEELLADRISAFSFMDPEQMEEPQDAYISDYQFDTNSYEIVAESEGSELVEENVVRVIGQAVLELQNEIDLDMAGCYTKPTVRKADLKLNALAAELNRYVGAEVTHRFDENEEVLDGDLIHQWLTVDGDTVTLDETKISEYVRKLAKKYNTAYSERPFLTTYGDVVTVPGGSYGWRMNESKEAAAILEAVNEGAIRTREPEWIQRGASHGEYDYGDTYVEVNLTGQHLFFYKDGELLVECDFVSGNASKGWSTPAGIYPLTYKERNATLRGEDYATPVSYWMPFNGGIGLHDADWRGSFGGAIYKKNGSHGCVNLPPEAAKIIYTNISKGDPVICYHLEGTESTKTSKAREINTSGVPSVSSAANEAVSESSGSETTAVNSGSQTAKKPAQTKPAQTKPVTSETTPVVEEHVSEETSQANPETDSVITETRPASPQGVVLPDETSVSELRPVGAGSDLSPMGATQGSNGPTPIGATPGQQTPGPGQYFIMPETADAPTAP